MDGSIKFACKKFKAIHDKQVAKYGKCLTIVLGEFDGKEAAFLLQNMFPIRDFYLDHIHTRNNNPVPVKHSIHKEITTRMKKIRQLHSRGKKVVFPDIDRLEQIILPYSAFLPPTPRGLHRRTYQSSVPENQYTAQIQYSVA